VLCLRFKISNRTPILRNRRSCILRCRWVKRLDAKILIFGIFCE